ncbi:MAG TPA: cyclic lactone autoinducer peptide [Bacillota bacterium]|jgi:cyclic lactone autoinducer peptide|nr:cyclic lactone autoinducer peptide [Bacillota bacterium]HOC06548.1 cyclic lactone autoinducer peptide [Bacillota bacterium]HPZ22446.1 cyclic lactone autoinducer peptide [Bacillota bacterium]HQD19880.1 cyclic lactone autoinducer peptide [Bacillota bacterium]
MKKLTRILATVMLAVGTIGLIKPMCIAYFYSPKKPAALR